MPIRFHHALAALVAVAALVLGACGSGGGDASAAPSSDPLGVTARTVAGGSVDLAEFRGQDLVLWFWAPW